MLIEILVLGGDESFGDAVGDGAERHIDAPLAGKLGDQVAVIGVNAGHDRRLVFGEHFVVRQILRHLPQDERRRSRHGHEDDHACGEQEPEEAQQEAAATATPPLLRRLDRSRNVHIDPVPSPIFRRLWEPSNPSQHYGNKTLPITDFVLIFGGNWTRDATTKLRTASAPRAWRNTRRSPRLLSRPWRRARFRR